MTKIIIVRHGETKWNELHKVQGHSDQPLSKKGIIQAQHLSKRLSKLKIDAVYTSRLKRAIETAKIAISSPLHKGIRINSTPILNEMDWGEWEGLTFDEIKKKFPEEYAMREKSKFSFAPRGGESPKVLKKRLTPFAKKIVSTHKGKTVLIVGHGGINRVLMGLFLEWSDERIVKTFTLNTSVTILFVRKPKGRLHLFNCTKHLEI